MKTLFRIGAIVALLMGTASAQKVEEHETGPKEYPQSVAKVRAAPVANLVPMLGNPNPNIIYTMPQASERVWNPMAIKMGVTTSWFYHKTSNDDQNVSARGLAIWELFRWVEDKPENFEIIRVERVIADPTTGSGSTKAAIWFTYIEKQFVLPIK